MTVPLAPERYRFTFERTTGDRVALPITLVGLLLAAGFALVDHRRRGLAWLAWPLEEATRTLETLSGEAWRRPRITGSRGCRRGCRRSRCSLRR